MGSFTTTPVGKGFEARTDRGLPATPEQIAAIKKILNDYPDIAAVLSVAAACDKYASVADFSVGPQKFLDGNLNGGFNDVRTASRYFGWQMQTLIAEGKQDEAAKLGIECLKLARLCDNEPLVVNTLIGSAIRYTTIHSIYDALATGPITAATRTALDQELGAQRRSAAIGPSPEDRAGI